MMGHSEVEMQFTYTVGVDENKRRGAERLENPELLCNHRFRGWDRPVSNR